MIQLSRRGPVAVVTLARPPVNALNGELLAAFHDVLDTLESQSDWTLLHIRSAQKVFVGGADIAFMSDMSKFDDPSAEMAKYLRPFQGLFKRLEELPQVTLAEINGAAMGGGFELALACDLRIAAKEAKIALPEIGLGLIPAAGGTQRLTRLCGPGIASRIIFSTEPVDGATAETLGMVQWSFSQAELEAKAAAIADRIAASHPEALKIAKRCIRNAAQTPDIGYNMELQGIADLIRTPETQRRLTAFFNRGK
ncbi:MAG: enoyl-CoA hydratase/isomerase family protein [Proteobacteria bacterium]|nr:enoyl-CoA hydratase/isomerase family protein [Pseudomonadota bacterium]HQR02947.1 enoyl-CoA hydratase/isomerase family protein [Rhodocyclaceae bacterium]